MKLHGLIFVLPLLVAACAGAKEVPEPADPAGVLIAPDDSTVQYGFGEPMQVGDGDCDMNGNRITDFRVRFTDNEPGTSIAGCNRMIDYSVGVAYGNFYYGADLDLLRNGKPVRAMVCFDEAVGHFAVEEIDAPASKRRLIGFTVDNCGHS